MAAPRPRRWSRRAGAVGVDVADAAGGLVLTPGLRGIFKRPPDRQRRALGLGLRDVVGVGRHAKADDLGIDVRAAGERASSGSSTSMAAPSPSVMPSRSAENGRHEVGETTRIESHARRKPKVSGASYPPAIAAGACRAHHLEREADGVRARGAGGRNVQHRPADAQVDGDVAGARAGHGAHDGQWDARARCGYRDGGWRPRRRRGRHRRSR
jgi:hypothetical protein